MIPAVRRGAADASFDRISDMKQALTKADDILAPTTAI
jgi:hypothetical protein